MSAKPRQPSLLARRFGALLYDSALVGSLLFFATIPAVIAHGGEAFDSGDPLYLGYLLAVSFFYFGWSWTRGGQTLGMKAWRLAACTRDRRGLSWGRALARFGLALACLVPVFGLGLLSMLFNRERRALHDRLSGTEIRLLG